MLRKLAKTRPDRADCAAILDAAHKGTYGGLNRDFESRTGSPKKEKEKEKAANGKTRTNKTKSNEAKTDGDAASKAPKGRRWEKLAGGDWANWRTQQETKDAPDVTKTEEKTDKEKKMKTDAK